MQRTKTGGAYDWDLDYPSPSMLRVYVFLVDWRVAVAVTTRLVWVFKPRGRMQRTKTGGAYDWDLDYPFPPIPRVYVLLGSAADGCRRAGLGGAGCSYGAVCLVALVLLFVVTVFAM